MHPAAVASSVGRCCVQRSSCFVPPLCQLPHLFKFYFKNCQHVHIQNGVPGLVCHSSLRFRFGTRPSPLLTTEAHQQLYYSDSFRVKEGWLKERLGAGRGGVGGLKNKTFHLEMMQLVAWDEQRLSRESPGCQSRPPWEVCDEDLEAIGLEDPLRILDASPARTVLRGETSRLGRLWAPVFAPEPFLRC